MTTCLIFGGNGFIGSHLAEELVRKKYNVRVFDNFKTGTVNLKSIINIIEIIKGDFLNEKDISEIFKDVDYVFHYISTTVPVTATKDPLYDITTNIIGSVQLMRSAINNNVKKIFFSSSGGLIYGEPVHLPCREIDPVNPINPYAISKLAIERYLGHFYDAYGLDYAIIRYSNPYGERQNPYGKQGVIPIFLNKIMKGEMPVVYGDGSMVRDYIYVKDAVQATLAVLEKKPSGKVFNVGSGDGTSLNELVAIMTEIVGKEITPTYMNNGGEYIQKVVLDISKIWRETGWKPTTILKEGIQKTWLWLNEESARSNESL